MLNKPAFSALRNATQQRKTSIPRSDWTRG